MTPRARIAAEWVLGALLGAVFVYASVDKILQPVEFAKIVYHYQLVGPSQHVGPLAANLVAVTLPWIELLTGLLLAAGVWRREAAIVAAGMLVAFLLAVGAAMARGIDLANCGCFTVGSGDGRQVGLQLVAGDLLLLGAALFLARPRPALTRPEPHA